MTSRPAHLDPIVEEVRERGRRFTARYDNDIWKLFEYFKKQQAEHPERYVSENRVLKAGSLPQSDAEEGPPDAKSPDVHGQGAH